MANTVLNKKDKDFKLSLDIKEVANLVGSTCIECYGVLGLTNKVATRNKLTLLKKDKYVEGVELKKEKGGFVVDVHLVCAYGVKVSEIATEVNKRICYILRRKYGELFKQVNVYVDELREL